MIRQKALAIGLAVLGALFLFALFKIVLASVFWMIRLAVIVAACVALGMLIRKMWR